MKKCVLLLSLFALSVPAAADDGFYVTGSVGGSFLWSIDDGPYDEDHYDEDSDITFGGGVGYRFADYWAIEAGYQKLGSFGISNSSVLSAIGAGEFDSIEVDFQGFTIGAAAIFPVADQVSVYAELGGYIYDADYVFESGGVTVIIEEFEGIDDNGEAVYLGGGALYHFTDQLSIGAEYMSYVEDNAHIGTFSAVVHFNF